MQTKNFIEFPVSINDKEIRLQVEGGTKYGEVMDALIDHKNTIIQLLEAQFPKESPQDPQTEEKVEECQES